jgi:hypothetical protein
VVVVVCGTVVVVCGEVGELGEGGTVVVEDVELPGFPAPAAVPAGVTLGGVARPGSGAPATSPASVADLGLANGTPGAGGCLGSGGMPSSCSASRAIVANVGADAAAP